MSLLDRNGLRFSGRHHQVFWQALRFGVAGIALTTLVSAIYYAQISYTESSPALALTAATFVASVIGYFVHGHFSFRAHGSRENPARRLVRFLVTNGLGYLLNLAFVFAMINVLDWPNWTPMIGFCLITPAASFLLNRHWVFG